MLREYIRNERIAYFSMEIALQNNIPTYSGGLGVLAGDTLRSAADLEMPMVAVTLVSRLGFSVRHWTMRVAKARAPTPGRLKSMHAPCRPRWP